MASATSSRRPTRPERALLPAARSLAAPLRALAHARKVAPLLYFEIDCGDRSKSADREDLAACVARALKGAVGSQLRRGDRVVAGPHSRWHAALLLGRAVQAAARSAVSDADLGIVAGRLRGAIEAEVRAAFDGAQAGGHTVRAGWTIIEPRDAERPLAELRHALRGAAVVARIEARRGTVLAAVTHELRTPLTSILGFAEELRAQANGAPWARPRRRALGSGSAVRALHIIEEEARRLKRLVDGLIDAGAWQAGSLQLRRRQASLGTIARRAARLVSPAARERRISVTIRGAAKSHVDEDRVLQILVNLLDNAVRHARPGGSVVVCVSVRRNGAAIVVSDDGPGFESDLLARLGTPFGIGANGHVGLGLAIASMLCAAHGGDLSFGQSRRGGARVTVRLPW